MSRLTASLREQRAEDTKVDAAIAANLRRFGMARIECAGQEAKHAA